MPDSVQFHCRTNDCAMQHVLCTKKKKNMYYALSTVDICFASVICYFFTGDAKIPAIGPRHATNKNADIRSLSQNIICKCLRKYFFDHKGKSICLW